MFDYIQYGIIPYTIQVKILKLGLESPTCKIIKKIKLPILIYSREPQSFSDIYFLFFIR